ncbi:bifunctional methylenetetrahydrofolate dehydrogenase/methenyltetrahydrofolate cyclohydrolase FolD [Gorillibacterium massiliense]|uniref:bifunctional methylenetetrahydrofolate dehydrogenase/methenyltetrahydrofolate cyclohydrolase FolD n=1 Tax=Gorillibacterium massiliense TaxID=1280390 RepID=UPI0004B36E03|nr:bifunctional methylenetetrahydrofolate dehydrogenase/methenyltetrahydrofolate cyclohydrolase FolD [Gorillibacterium massiliense]
MTATIINGKEIVASVRDGIKQEVHRMANEGRQPGLAVILVGNDPASAVYVRNKEKACHEVGMYSELHRLPEETSEQELLTLISQLNVNPRINGILVQLPLPAHINEETVIDTISVHKDVDCFHPINVGNLMIGKKGLLPCTPAGVIEVLRYLNVPLAGKHAVIIGRSNIVGKPMAMLMLRENATVTVCHSRTDNLPEIARQADILIAAVGRAKMVTKEYIKPGAIVIDVGMNRDENDKLCGDVDFNDVLETASYVTPVPGCVGPMTITMLLKNTLEAAEHAGPNVPAR